MGGWTILPEGELGAEGWAADLAPVGIRDVGSCLTLSWGCYGASPGPSSENPDADSDGPEFTHLV